MSFFKRTQLPLLMFFLSLIVFIVTLIYIYLSNKISSQQTTHSEQIYLTPSNSEPTKEIQVSISPTIAIDEIIPLSNLIHNVLPNGWITGDSSDENSFSLFKNLNGIKYVFGFQLNTEEFFKQGGAYTRDLTLIKKVKTSKGTNLYIIKDDVFVYVSSCQPTKNSACSIKLGKKLLFIMLYAFETSQAPGIIDFNNPDTDEVIADFIKIIESSAI